MMGVPSYRTLKGFLNFKLTGLDWTQLRSLVLLEHLAVLINQRHSNSYLVSLISIYWRTSSSPFLHLHIHFHFICIHFDKFELPFAWILSRIALIRSLWRPPFNLWSIRTCFCTTLKFIIWISCKDEAVLFLWKIWPYLGKMFFPYSALSVIGECERLTFHHFVSVGRKGFHSYSLNVNQLGGWWQDEERGGWVGVCVRFAECWVLTFRPRQHLLLLQLPPASRKEGVWQGGREGARWVLLGDRHLCGRPWWVVGRVGSRLGCRRVGRRAWVSFLTLHGCS